VCFFIVLILSGIGPKDQFTWFLAVLPALIDLVLIVISFQSFELTRLLYNLILLHCIVLMVGGYYTYAEVPLFDTIGNWMGSERNNYDKEEAFFPRLCARFTCP
jgi:putative membrane protein